MILSAHPARLSWAAPPDTWLQMWSELMDADTLTHGAKRPRPWGVWALSVLLVLISVFGLGFVAHAVQLGVQGLTQDLSETSRLYSESVGANFAIFAHMISGAVITFLAPLQLVPVLRRRWPKAHRVSGRLIVVTALLTALGGLAYMALRGTVGGAPMTLAFTIYGLAVAGCAVQTIRMARARRWQAHQDWAVRLFFLCIASLLYRVHYGLWFSTMGYVAVERDFSGAFDLFNIWAFYVPYLLAVELALWRRGRGLGAWCTARLRAAG